MHEHNLNTEQNDLIEKQIKTDDFISRQLQEEERGQVLNQIEYDESTKYHIDRCQVQLENDEQTPEAEDKSFVRAFTASQPQNYHG